MSFALLCSSAFLPLSAAYAEGADDAAEEAGRDAIVVTAHALREGEIGKADIPLLQTPQAISVVTAETIRNQGLTSLGDALRGVAGVSRSSTYGYYDAYTIRGYDTAYDSLYLDGLITSSAAGARFELFGLERVEVLKGPASMLYGAAPVGGVVNLVSKRPQDHAFVDVGLATGSYDLMEATLDANAPLNASGTLLGRLTVLVEDADDFVRFSGENRLFVAPSLTWKPGPDTSLTVLGRWQRDHDHPWSPVSAWGSVLPNANGQFPIDFSVNFTGDQRARHNQNRKSIGYVFDHSFTDWLSFSQTLRYTHATTFWDNWMFSDLYVDSNIVDGVEQSHILGLFLYGPFRHTAKDFGVDSRATIKFDTGSLSHQILAGIDYRQSRTRSEEGGGNYDYTKNTLDILDPDYTKPLIHDPSLAYATKSRSRQTGLYLQDHIGIGDRFFLTLGGRFDWVNSDGKKDDAFSPRVGANFIFAPGVSVYASWSRSFTPQFGWQQSYDGKALPNGKGRNLEAGLKVSSPDGRLSGAAAVFDLVRTNVATSDPEHFGFYLVTGEQRSRGFELEGVWKPIDPLTLSLAYTYLDAKVTRDNVIPEGTKLWNIPKHNLFLRGEYEVQEGPLAGLGASLSLLWNSRKNTTLYNSLIDIDGDGDLDSDIPLPSYVIADGGLSYRRGDWTLRLFVENIFDKRYYSDANDYTRVTPGEPRNWRLALSRRF